MNRERVKTIILSILVATSVLLTNQIWKFSPIGVMRSDAANNKNQQAVIEAKSQVISPRQVTVGYGASFPRHSGTVLNYDDMKEAWELSKLILAPFFIENSDIKQITNEIYIENYLRQYIELEFGENLSSVLVSSIFNKEIDNKLVGSIREIKKVLIPASYKGTIYIIGKDSNTFQLTLENYENSFFIDYIIDIRSKGYSEYRPLFHLYGNYTTLLPNSFTTPIPQLFIESVIDIENQSSLTNKAKTFFDNFDYVKTIKETSGALVYLYGYGEKSLRVNPSGRLIYTEDVGNSSSTDVISALDEALEFIERHGGLPANSYLAAVENVGFNKGYYFGFSYFVDGYPIAFHSNNINYPVEIEVYGDKIKSYKSFTRKKMTLPSIPKQENIESPFKVIENNINLLNGEYMRLNNLQELESKSEILTHIDAVEMVYFDTMQEKRRQILLPAWKIKIQDRVYYFDSYKGELLNSNILN